VGEIVSLEGGGEVWESLNLGSLGSKGDIEDQRSVVKSRSFVGVRRDRSSIKIKRRGGDLLPPRVLKIGILLGGSRCRPPWLNTSDYVVAEDGRGGGDMNSRRLGELKRPTKT